MPRLGSFLICEKIIIDQQQKPSLISVFQSISALVPEGQPIPKDTVTFIPWSIFSEWYFTDEEITKKVEQVVEVLLPDGSQSPISGRLMFAQFSPSGEGTRSYVNLFGMPISESGFITVNTWMEVDSKRETDVFPYRIKIEHTQQPPKPNDGGLIIPTLTAQRKPN